MTTQLRRYRLRDDVWEEFLPWWRSELVPAREAHGFAVEFAYRIEDSNEFVWAVSLPGDAERFAEVEARYLSSDERAAAFAGRDPWTESSAIDLVEVIA